MADRDPRALLFSQLADLLDHNIEGGTDEWRARDAEIMATMRQGHDVARHVGEHTQRVIWDVNHTVGLHIWGRRAVAQCRWLAGEQVDCAECGLQVAAGDTVWDKQGVLRHEECVTAESG